MVVAVRSPRASYFIHVKDVIVVIISVYGIVESVIVVVSAGIRPVFIQVVAVVNSIVINVIVKTIFYAVIVMVINICVIISVCNFF